ncbi:unnamed protein product, partial [Brassica oleracea]
CGSERWRLPQIRRRRLFSGGWRFLQLRRRRFKFPGRESALPMRNPKLLGQGYYCSFSAKLEVVTV